MCGRYLSPLGPLTMSQCRRSWQEVGSLAWPLCSKPLPPCSMLAGTPIVGMLTHALDNPARNPYQQS